MKRLFATVIFLLPFLSCFSQLEPDVLHYKFSIELNDNNDTIYGRAEIRLQVLAGTKKEKGIPVDKFSLDLVTRNAKGSQMMIDKITGTGFNRFTANNETVSLFLNQGKVKTGDTLSYIIDYHGIPSDGLIISKNKYNARTFFADNWPNRAHHWIPCHDDPSDKATVEFLVTAPSHYQVISNGVQLEETDLPNNKKLTHYREEQPLPTKIMVIGAAAFAVSQVGMVDCIPVSTWVFRENKTEGFFDYAIAKEILTYHANYIAPFPYKKLANIQSKTIFGGMENAGAIFYSENSVTGQRENEELMSHEIVHQWFGDMATEKSFAHLWLSEGFATYLTHMYIGSKYGKDSLDEEMRIDRQTIIDFVKSSKKPVVDSTNALMTLLNPNSYQKGSWVLHMLRKQLGDSVFKKAIRLYYATYGGKNAETDDLRKIFETVSGKKLNTFFKQWLFTPYNPSLEINWTYNDQQKTINLSVTQMQPNTFDLPLEILIQQEGKSFITSKQLSNKTTEWTIPVSSKPLKMVVDPNVSLLYEGSVNERSNKK